MTILTEISGDCDLAKRILVAFTLAAVAYPIGTAFYNLYLHPLAKYPGPTIWTAFRAPFVISLLKGDLVHDIQKIHRKYGDIVRTAPNEISVSHPDGWKEIYAHRPGHKPFPKDPIWWGGKSTGRPESLINAEDPADHQRMRRLLDHSFSEKALAGQEPLIQSYVDFLITRLRECATANGKSQGGVVDIVKWYNFTTFDIVGDLGFGEPFDCLKNSTYHTWVATVFSHFKSGVFLAAVRFFLPVTQVLNLVDSVRFYPLVAKALMMCLPKSLMKAAMDNYKQSLEKIHRRLNLETERPDFMTPVLRYNDEKGMTIPEIEGTFNIVIVAGSETTATVLSGVTNYLTQNPTTLKKLVEEIRSTFKNEEDITFASAKGLEYLNAVIKEGLRMCPPTPAGLPRVIPAGGDTVCGHWFPGGTAISLHQWSTYRSPTNFHSPESFIPERWLPSSSTEPSSAYYNDKRNAVQNFSLGPRNCIGKNLAWAEMRLVLAKIMWNFDISVAKGPDGKEKVLDWAQQKTWILVQKKSFEVKLVSVRD